MPRMKTGVRHLVPLFRRSRNRGTRCLTPVFNDGVRRLIGMLIGWLGLVMGMLHWIQVVSFSYNQKRLRRRYRIDADTPILSYGTELQQHIRNAAAGYRSSGVETIDAQTSGSTSVPKHILYTKARLRSVRWMFIDTFVRSFRAYRVRRKSVA